jgi:mutator protein MutT
MQPINAAIAVVIRQGKVLVCQRKTDDVLGGFWEFPGGKCEDGETLEQCIQRELIEEVNIRARPLATLSPIEHHYPHGHVRLHPYLCEHESGEPQLLECQAALWIDPGDLPKYQFPPANERLIEEVLEYFRASRRGWA